ncbi:MAG: glutamylcysteine synthetase [Oscillospiraceae bacterium]|nr:glutamylcysteine synthetase [Oscillospiraceae bacterium]
MTLEEAIYQKYIVPTQRPAGRYVGVELEFPLVNLRRRPVDVPAVQTVVRDFAERFGFTEQRTDDGGNLYSMTEPATGDNVSFDCSYNTLEFSFGKEERITELDRRYRQYAGALQEGLRACGHLLTGLGIHPYYRYNEYEPIRNDRYRMLYHHLCAYKEWGGFFHHVPQFGMMAAASQVQLDVEEGVILQTLDVCNRLEPYKAILFANSFYDELPALSLARDYLWGYSTQGYNPHNLGMYRRVPETLGEYVGYVKSQSIYCVQKEDKYLHFKPVPLYDYVTRDAVTGTYYADGDWHTHTFRPDVEDLAHHRTFKFADLTYRGTIEYRSACEQPMQEAFTHAAFHAGLAECLDELGALLDADTVLYHQGFDAAELRELMTYRELPGFVDRTALSRQLEAILKLAEKGLTRRGFGEEGYLAPLYARVQQLTNPALMLLAGLEAGDAIETWIERYAI